MTELRQYNTGAWESGPNCGT